MLVILDGSDSMNADAGNGGTRLDAAKAALTELIAAVPEGAKVGLRVYGNELSGVSRAKGCRDTNLVTPVGPLDKDAFRSEVQGLEGKGRTPIGRSLLKAPEDLGPSGDRTVILVSDGGGRRGARRGPGRARHRARRLRGAQALTTLAELLANPQFLRL